MNGVMRRNEKRSGREVGRKRLELGGKGESFGGKE